MNEWCICEPTTVRDVLAWFGLFALLILFLASAWLVAPRRRGK